MTLGNFSALTPVQWTLVVPFKGSSAAKSRLSIAQDQYQPLEDDALRLRLARAFLQDTVAAALDANNVMQVVVVSSDPLLRQSLNKMKLIEDPGEGLNAAISAGFAHARVITPDTPVAVLTGDLPGLVSADLELALQAAENYPLSVVADHAFSGTTMITALPGHNLEPKFGTNSHQKHIDSGYHSIAISPESTLRHDVDTPRDLARALRNGVGVATADVISTLSRRTGEKIHYITLPLERTP
jgi:2-phospho-L-lactate guanylyltransferase